MIRALGIYKIHNRRYIATGKKIGLVYEFKECSNPRGRSVYYPSRKCNLIYWGNTQPNNIYPTGK